MKRLALAFLALGGCMGSEPPTPPPQPKPAPAPAPAPAAEPDRITVQHILISFAGTRTKATRSKAEAEKLGAEVLMRTKKSEDFDKLMKELSDDTGPGVYSLFNNGAEKQAPDEYARKQMVPAFGDVGFKLAVGEIGLAAYEPRTSPFGWHIIKRIK